MKRICPITYEWIENDLQHPFDPKGLKQLSPHLKRLEALPFTQQELRELATSQQQSGETALQGKQAKAAMMLEVKNGRFRPDPQRGRYLIKPQDSALEKLPENEAITLYLAHIAGLKTAPTGLIDLGPDNSFALWTRRVDRIGQATQLNLTSLASLASTSALEETTENLIQLIEKHSSFPAKEKGIIFKTFLFNFIVGNSEMKLNKWHLLTTPKGVTQLAPLFGIRNTSLYGPGVFESSLPLANNGSRLEKSTILQYLGRELLSLPEAFLKKTTDSMIHHAIAWKLALDRSYLSPLQKFDYQQMLTERINRLR